MSDLHTIAISNTDRKATPVAFLHGFGGVGAQWWGHQTAASFKAPTYAFDLPGHGKSINYPKAGPPKMAARAVLEKMDELGVDKLHLVGHSMGGAISSLIALIAPERVESLLLLAPGGYGTEFNHPLLMQWAAAQTADELADVMPNFFGSKFDLPQKVIDFQLDVRSQNGAVEQLLAIATGMSSDGKQGVLPVDDVIATGVPITVVWGTEDKVLPVSQAHALEGRVDLHIVDGVGHSPAEEANDLVRALIDDRISS